MSTTAQQVFELAIYLMDEQNEGTGAADTVDTASYKNRTLAILTILQEECWPYSDTYGISQAGVRPICPMLAEFTSPLALDDAICRGVLPYGLAAHLLLDDNPGTASYFSQRYEERKAAVKSALPRVFGAIEDVYGGIGFSGTARW